MAANFASRIALIAVALLAGAAPATGPATRPADRQLAATFELRTDVRYLRYLPPGYEADPTNAKSGDGRGWPLVLFLHGAGERGDDVSVLTVTGLPKVIADGADFPFVMISPQCPKDEWWSVPVLLRLLDRVERDLTIDPDRVYVTGLSMGGYGTWDLARSRPERFAAIAPICGGGDPERIGRSKGAAALPVWAFHGEKDDVVPARRSEEMVDALRAAGNGAVKLTIYPGVGHDSWTRAYADPELFRWLLSHRRGGPATRPS